MMKIATRRIRSRRCCNPRADVVSRSTEPPSSKRSCRDQSAISNSARNARNQVKEMRSKGSASRPRSARETPPIPCPAKARDENSKLQQRLSSEAELSALKRRVAAMERAAAGGCQRFNGQH